MFEVAAGSITGRDHLLTGKNNQDAYYSSISDRAVIAVVCDGCGSSPHSEVGAKLGARLTVAAIAKTLADQSEEQPLEAHFWERVQQALLLQLQTLAQAMGNSGSQTVRDYFLFTTVGALITDRDAFLFSVGDGILILNGAIQQIGPFPGNQPPYLAYGLVQSALPETALRFQIHQQLALETVETILIGSDGVADLIQAAESLLPGKTEVVGPISQFWQMDRYFTNPDMIRRRLALLNREVITPDWHSQRLTKAGGLLPDDTTFVVIRRCKA